MRETAARSDLFVVPGGSGIDRAMLDSDWVAYTRREAERAKYVFGICTGSLLLAASGVLRGRKAGGHWLSRALLAEFGAVPSDDRMTLDGKFYTSGGVTSGIDMALRVVADTVDEETARKIQLQIEYDPEPPFVGGTPRTSPPEITSALREAGRERCAKRELIVAEAAARLRCCCSPAAVRRADTMAIHACNRQLQLNYQQSAHAGETALRKLVALTG
jgi:cyclohexyl-isocyanide hydratase